MGFTSPRRPKLQLGTTRRHMLRRLQGLLALVITLGVSVQTAAQEPGLQVGETDVRPIEFPHLQEMGLTAEAWTLAVPENREKAESRAIQLVFARIKSTSANPGPPLIFLAGGPGQSATSAVASPDTVRGFLPLLELGDVIWLDQRGTGRSKPNLTFKDQEQPPLDVFASEENLKDVLLKIATDGAEHFRAEGADLSGYTTAQNADDLEDIRQALGAEKLNLLGFSYGTHLALATIRRHENALENVVVIGVEGLDHTYKLPQSLDTQFSKLALLVEQDPNLEMTAAEFSALLTQVFEKLDETPMSVSVSHPQTGEELEMPVGRFALQLLLRLDVGDRSDLVVFPRLLSSIDRGDASVLRWFVQKRLAMLGGMNLMYLIMDPASGASKERMQAIDAQAARSPFGNVVNFPMYPEIADVLGTPDLGENFRAPLVSDVRTLFLTGTLDWNTPPYQAEEVRWGFTDGTHITVKNAGHEQVLSHPEVQQAIVDFLRGAQVGDREISMPALRFVPLDGTSTEVTHPAIQ